MSFGYSKRRGEKFFCACATCESIAYNRALDYRYFGDKAPKYFKERECKFCPALGRIPSKYFDAVQIIRQPYFVPDHVREFLGMAWLCDRCMGQIHWRVHRQLHMCWQTIPYEAACIAVLWVIRDELKLLAATEFRHKFMITKTIKEGGSLSPWAANYPEHVQSRQQLYGASPLV